MKERDFLNLNRNGVERHKERPTMTLAPRTQRREWRIAVLLPVEENVDATVTIRLIGWLDIHPGVVKTKLNKNGAIGIGWPVVPPTLPP